MLLNAVIGYVLAVIEDENKKKKRSHVGNHRDGMPGKTRRTSKGKKRGRR